MSINTSVVTTYEVTCDTTGCTETWTGTDLTAATDWVMTNGTWSLSSQPSALTVRCPSHAS